MDEMYLGYSPSNAVNLIKKIVAHYSAIGTTITDSWPTLRDSLRTEWIGGDQQSYENEFVKKICGLYVTSYELTKNCVNNIKVVLDNYIEVQKQNLLEGAEKDATQYDATLNSLSNTAGDAIAELAKNEAIITFTAKSFDDDTARGLKSSNSAEILKLSVKDYVDAVVLKVDSLTESINVKSAFFGESGGKLESYIIAVKDAVKTVTTAVKDLNDALNKMAGSNYTTMTGNMEQQLGTATTEVASEVESNVQSRWSVSE